MTQHGALLQAIGICKRFGGVTALENVSLALNSGEVVGLLGDNGAGKSTFVKIISGVYAADQGELHFEGQRVRFRSSADARVAGIETVHQDLALVETMSIMRNFFLAHEPRKGPFLDRKKMAADTRRALEEIGLTNLRDYEADVSVLSGGERQAISIGRAMFFGRKMLILDEPTSALSVKETDKVFEYVRVAKARNLAVIVVMHNLAQIRHLVDRYVVFWHGRCVSDFVNQGESETELARYIIYGEERFDQSALAVPSALAQEES